MFPLQGDAVAQPKFETAMKRLEEIVAKMESGEPSLEESLKLFEEGIKLSRMLNKKLDEAQRRVEVLIKEEDGSLGARPFKEAGEQED